MYLFPPCLTFTGRIQFSEHIYFIKFYIMATRACDINIAVYSILQSMKKCAVACQNRLWVKSNYKYSKYTELKSGEIGWKYIEKTCKAKLYTFGIDNNFSRESVTLTHSHENIDTYIGYIIVQQTISKVRTVVCHE